MRGKTIEEINQIKEKALKENELQSNFTKVYVHTGTCGIASGALEVLNTLKKEIKENGLKNIKVITTGCAGICSKEPLLTVEVPGQEPIIYEKINEEKA